MKVRVNSLYTFDPVGLDVYSPKSTAKKGDLVIVKNLPGCPKANTMGHCHIHFANPFTYETEEFAGLVLCNSLTPFKRPRK